MSTAAAIERLAALQAEQARQFEELRAELAPKVPKKQAKSGKRRRRVYSPPRAELGPVSDLDRAWARRLLRSHGR